MARSFVFSRAFADIFSSFGNAALRYPVSIAGSLLFTCGLIALDIASASLDPANSKETFWTGVVFTGLTLLPLGVLAKLAAEAWGRNWLMIFSSLAVGGALLSESP